MQRPEQCRKIQHYELRTLKVLIQDLQAPAYLVRLKAVRDSGWQKAPCTIEAAPFALKHDKRKSVRRSAAETPGTLGDVRTVAPLIHTLLHDKCKKYVRQQVAYVRRALGDARAFKPMTSTLRVESTKVRKAAARALAHLSVRTGRIELALQAIAVDVDKAFKGISAAVVERKGTPTVSRRLLRYSADIRPYVTIRICSRK